MEQQHTQEHFVREPRYLVFKIKDTEKYLTQGEKDSLMSIGDEISCARADEGKPPFNAVVVEQDWPEFDLVWEMIEARIGGKGNDARRIVACVNACAGIPTEALGNEPGEVVAALEFYKHQRNELLATVIAAASLAHHESAVKALLDDALARVKGGAA